MTENAFDLDAYHRVPGLTLRTELALVAIDKNCLKILMIARDRQPFARKLVLPGAYLDNDLSLVVSTKFLLAKLKVLDLDVHLVDVFSDPGRDQRARCVSVLYFARASFATLKECTQRDRRFQIVTLEPDRSFSLTCEGEEVQIGFDHRDMISSLLRYLNRMLDNSLIAFEFLPPRFTLHDLQSVHEVIGLKRLEKVTFRKRMLARKFPGGQRLVPLDEAKQTKGRPAKLYELKRVRGTGK